MKKRNFLGGILLTIAMLLVPSSIVEADSPFELTCNDKAANGEIIECKLEYVGSNSETINSLRGTLELSSIFTLDTADFNKSFDNPEINKSNLAFTATSTDGVSTSDTILTFKLKTSVKDSTKTSDQVKLKISTVDGSMGSSTNHNITSNVIKLEIKDENRLSSLKVSDGTLSPSFDSDTLIYSLKTEEDEITITATPKDTLATVEINGKSSSTVKLDYGDNKIEIKVTAQDGTTKTYTLKVERTDVRDDNTKLQLLSVDGKKISLKTNNYNYTVDVPYTTEEANLLYAASSSTSTVEVKGSETLKVGENNIIIEVTSEKGTVEKYYLTINRLKEIKSDDSSLSKLEILNVDDVNINFRSDNHNYTIKVPKKLEKLILNVEPNDSKATYEIKGNDDLENFSKVLIKVTAEDESTTTYTILIEKQESNNLMVILIILILVLIGIVVGIVLILKNKKNKNDKNNQNNIPENKVEEQPKKEESSVVVFTDPGDEVIKDTQEVVTSEPEEKKEEVVVFTDPDEKSEELNEEKEDTKEFIIQRPVTLDNPEFEENKVQLENPDFTEKDMNNEENPNFE